MRKGAEEKEGAATATRRAAAVAGVRAVIAATIPKWKHGDDSHGGHVLRALTGGKGGAL